MKKLILIALTLLVCRIGFAQPGEVRLLDPRKINQDYTHGQLPYAIGVHNIQTMRANRERPDLADGFGWTYNHAANLAYWNDTFFFHYLSDPHGEHIPSSQTLLMTSKDGYTWERPMVLFPPYRVPDGYTKEGFTEVAQGLDAIMHQRMGFYVTKDGSRLLALGYYGICMNPTDKPLDGNGIGRVVREIYQDGSFGPIYFIRINHGWSEATVDYPFYKRSKDKAFVAACEELLSDPLMMQQWVEEADRDDPLIPIKNPNLKGFNYTTLPDGRILALYKNGFYTISTDQGYTWSNPVKIENLITGSAKSWVQQAADGTYAMVYNPTFFRWPMALVTSTDGLNWNHMLNVHGEVSPMRYSGLEKSWGPQYLRGIMPGNGIVPDGNIWLAYSVNKEDMWSMRITVPIQDKASVHADENLSRYNHLSELNRWNVYSPLWAPVSIQKAPNGENALRLADWDPYDYAKAEYFFPDSPVVTAEFSVIPNQNDTGELCIELQNAENYAGTRIVFDRQGMIRLKRGYKFSDLDPYEPGKQYDIMLSADARSQQVTVSVNGGRQVRNVMYGQTDRFCKIVFRTGVDFNVPMVEIMADEEWILPGAGEPQNMAAFYLLSLKTK
ncbi:MAG: glycoside hydrolase [Rikenellaceae bacterium]|nr:glycoside hydrolase [Rikenellaceae bacterium]